MASDNSKKLQIIDGNEKFQWIVNLFSCNNVVKIFSILFICLRLSQYYSHSGIPGF